MGKFVNPGNTAFQIALNSQIYVDKTGLIEYTNRVMDTEQAWICNSRPRRFGKSITANMLAAYYSKGCDSEEIFEGTAISRAETYREHLNKYDVIHFDVQWFLTQLDSTEKVVQSIKESILEELREYYPDEIKSVNLSLAGALSDIHQATGRKFVVIIDEWDVLIRDEATNAKIQEEYINFLRGMFKGTEPTKFLHLAFLTGILPIKKMKTQSALNNFEEYTMLAPANFAPYIGFTEKEVMELCEQYKMDYEKVKHWYDGYRLGEEHVYNPKAVVSVMMRGEYQSYWSKTGTYTSVLPFIGMNFDGLRTAIIQMLSGSMVEVNVNTFQNDVVSFRSKDDVITLLIHLGYLAYNRKRKAAYIPNEKIRQEFSDATAEEKWNDLIRFQQESSDLLNATLDMDCETVAEGIEKIHAQFASTIQYNDENSLSSVLTIAYLSSMRYYFMPVREMPTGRGFADYVYLPKPEYAEEFPALLVELKWNKKASTALQQIKEKKYVQAVSDYTGKILLVGISYDKKTKEHECIIEEYAG